jgi:adenosine deaminase
VSTPYIQKLRKNLIEELNKEVPKFLIEVHVKPNIKPKLSGLDITYKFPELKEFIKQHYKKDYTGDGFDIFRRNDD